MTAVAPLTFAPPGHPNRSYRFTPHQRFAAAFAPYLLDELSRPISAVVAPTQCGGGAATPGAGSAGAPIRNALVTRIERADFDPPVPPPATLSGLRRVYVRELTYPGRGSNPVAVGRDGRPAVAATGVSGARIASEIESYIYVFQISTGAILAEVHARPSGWRVRHNPGRAASDSGWVALNEPDFIEFEARGGSPDDYGVMLSPIRFRADAFAVLCDVPAGTSGSNVLHDATVRPRWGRRGVGYVALPDPFRWAVDEHQTFYLEVLEALESFVGDPRRAATRFVARTLKAWVDNHDQLGVQDELVPGEPEWGNRHYTPPLTTAHQVVQDCQAVEGFLRRRLEEAGEYLRECVHQPDFRAVERAGMAEGGQGLSAVYQTWAIVTTRLTDSHCGKRLGLELCRAGQGAEQRLPLRFLFGDAAPPQSIAAPFYIAGVCAVAIAHNLAFSMMILNRGAEVMEVFRRAGLPVEEQSFHDVFGSPPVGLPPQLAQMRFPQVIMPSPGNLLGHNMPQGQSSALLINGVFTLEQSDRPEETARRIRAGRDCILWMFQDRSIADKFPLIKTYVKGVNILNAIDKYRKAHAAHAPNEGRALSSLVSGVAGIVKILTKLAFDRAPRPLSDPSTGLFTALRTRGLPPAAEIDNWGHGFRRDYRAYRQEARNGADPYARRPGGLSGRHATTGRVDRWLSRPSALGAAPAVGATPARNAGEAVTRTAARRAAIDAAARRALPQAAIEAGAPTLRSDIRALATTVENGVRGTGRLVGLAAPDPNLANAALATRGGRILRVTGGLLGIVSAGCDLYSAVDSAVDSWENDDMGAVVGNIVIAGGSLGMLVLESISLAVALGCEMPWVLSVSEMAWPVAILGWLVSLGYVIIAAETMNPYEIFAGWSQFGTRFHDGDDRALYTQAWFPADLELPTPDPLKEYRALISLLLQFRLHRSAGGIDIHLGYCTENTVVRIIVIRDQEQTVPEDLRGPERLPARGRDLQSDGTFPDGSRPAVRALDGMNRPLPPVGAQRRDPLVDRIEIRGTQTEDTHVQFVAGASSGQGAFIRVTDQPMPEVPREPPRYLHYWTTRLTVRVQIVQEGEGGFSIPNDPSAWVELKSDAARSATATQVEVMSYDGSKWVDAEGHLRPYRHAASAIDASIEIDPSTPLRPPAPQPHSGATPHGFDDE